MALFLPQKGTKAQIDALPIVDGQLLWTTDQTENEIYYDDGLSRVTLKGGTLSYTPTASNLGTITTHLAMKKSGIARYALEARSGTWTSGTLYQIATLNSEYRPILSIKKEVSIRSGVTAFFSISTSGAVYIQPRASITDSTIYIDETYIL